MSYLSPRFFSRARLVSALFLAVLIPMLAGYGWMVYSSAIPREGSTLSKPIVVGFLFTVAVALLFAGLLARYIVQAIDHHLKRIGSDFSRWAGGEVGHRVGIQNGGPFDRFAGEINKGLDQLSETRQRRQAAEERFRLLFEEAVEGMFSLTPEGRFLNLNPAMAALFGYESPEEFLLAGADIRGWAGGPPAEMDRFLSELSRQGQVTGFETTGRRRDGTVFWLYLNARVLRDSRGAAARIDGFGSDVTSRKQAEETQLRIKTELEQRVEERTTELWDYIGKLEQRNEQESLLREMGGLLQVCRGTRESYTIIEEYARRLFPGYSGALFFFEETRSRLEKVVSWGSPRGIEADWVPDQCWALRQGKPYNLHDESRRLFCDHVHPDERIAYLCVPLIAQGAVLGLLHIQTFPDEVTEWEVRGQILQGLAGTFTSHLGLALANLRLQEKLREQSLRDPLTGLFNRRFMEEFAEQEIRRIKRHRLPLALILVDLDHFKSLNDNHGHDAGDLMLKELSGYLVRNCRDSDVPCRYGGEEFVILLPSCSLEDAAVKARALCREVPQQVHVLYQQATLSVTISAGVAASPVHGATLAAVFEAADKALYEAKRSGRDRAVVAEPPPSAAISGRE